MRSNAISLSNGQGSMSGVMGHGGRNDPFWTRNNDELFRALDAKSDGLSEDEAGARLIRYGPNLAVVSVRRSLIAKLLKRIAEPLVAILLIAAAISGMTGDWLSFVIILLIVAFSIVLDIFQEQKAETAVDALRRSVAVSAAIRRDGHVVEHPVRDIVPGDVVELRGGDLVPADGVVLASRGALANEAILTGEPYPAEKRPGPAESPAPADAFNALFGGTSIVGGEATMLVVATGSATRFGEIAALMQEKAAPTAFERGVHALGMLILRLTGFLVLFVLLTQLIRHGLSLQSFLFAVALAVGLTPELLPMIMTVTLSRGAVRMAGRQVVVKRLSAIHDLGAIDILCTDKTGTLTEAKIVHTGSFGVDGADSAAVTRLACLNARFASGMRSNLDEALLAVGQADDTACRRLDDVPFDFERRRSSVLVEAGGVCEMLTKGAPEALVALCTHVELADGSVVPLDPAMRTRIGALLDAKGRQGLRLLGVARRPMAADCTRIAPTDEKDLTFVGCTAFIDPPKPSVTAAVDRLGQAGVRLKVISGDAAPVVLHLVEILSLPASGVVTGDEIAKLSQTALAARVEEVDLFARIAPEQKSRIVRALRSRGHTVGFIGDGINDAPAIHMADVGISVDGGTDVARQAADIIMLAPDLGVLADGIAEGRRTYANIMKYVRMGTSSNFGNMLSMALASLVLPFLPLTPVQVLLNNLLYDVSEIGIPFDEADKEDIARPMAWDMGSVLRFMLVMGPLSSLFDIATFVLLYAGFGVGVDVFRTAWFVESIVTQILVIFIIRSTKSPWMSRPHPILVASSLGALAVALLLALTPIGRVFGFVPLPPVVLAAIALISVAYLVMAQGFKHIAMAPGRPARRRRAIA
ncbi:magnesium-translocating P-type ATPase [Nordella sp. HKS 07]|uniref:magnesium-translocating P-type ATPase n=1 Tax=Nordella sp. HKS 07 TaxID=2712222 RepID=UPI001FF05664|nr:magnesium-translocating P-type ATPase [Nordella sp. HKS 07]